MIHQPSGGMHGQSKDMEISLKQMQELRKDIYTILSDHTGKTYSEIEKDSDRDNWMRAEEAKKYKIATHILDEIPDTLINGIVEFAMEPVALELKSDK